MKKYLSLNNGAKFMQAKVCYKGNVYGLGVLPESFEALEALVKKTLPSNQQFGLFYKDSEEDLVQVTTTEALKEAASLQTRPLKLFVKDKQVTESPRLQLEDRTFGIKQCFEKMQAVFSVVVGTRVVGMGTVVNDRFAVTSSKVIPNQNTTTLAFGLFGGQTFQYVFEKLLVSGKELSLLSFEAPFALGDIKPVSLNTRTELKQGDAIYTLGAPEDNNPKASIKALQVKEVSGSKLYYDSSSPCGPAGSPVFDSDWELVGVQLSECQMQNEAVRCSIMYDIFKKAPNLTNFLSQICPQKPPGELQAYLEALRNSQPKNCIYGVTASKDHMITHQDQNINFTKLPEKLGEGYSLASIEVGVCISGGKTSPCKAWIYFSSTQCFGLEIPQEFYCHVSICFGQKVFLIGGKKLEVEKADVLSLDLPTQSWETMPKLNKKRSWPSACQVENHIYVLGGLDSSQELDSIERFDGVLWTELQLKMPFALYGAGTIQTNYNELLICGGRFQTSKSNTQLYWVKLDTESTLESTADCKLGILSACSPLYSSEKVSVYNQEGELVQYFYSNKVVSKTKKPLVISI